MILSGSVESVEKMEALLTKHFPARLVKDGSKPFLRFGSKQKSLKYTRKWQLFPPEEMTKMFPERSNVEFYYDTLGNTGNLRISDAGMQLLGKEFARLVLGNGLALVQQTEAKNTDTEVETAVVHHVVG